MRPVTTAIDRSILVPQGKVVKTEWISIWDCKLACRDRMAVGDVGVAYQRLLQQDGNAAWPLPVGYWDGETRGERFVICDGRHEYIAALMLGHSEILVAWVDNG